MCALNLIQENVQLFSNNESVKQNLPIRKPVGPSHTSAAVTKSAMDRRAFPSSRESIFMI